MKDVYDVSWVQLSRERIIRLLLACDLPNHISFARVPSMKLNSAHVLSMTVEEGAPPRRQ